MKNTYTYLLFLSVCITLLSCEKKDDCYYLNAEEASFYNSYQIDEEFKLKEESTGDVKIFTITKKTLELIDPPSNGGFGPYVGFGAYGGDTLVQLGQIEFSDNSGFKGWINVKPSSYYAFNTLYISLVDYPLNNYNINFTKNDNFNYIGNHTLNGVTYEKVYYFKSYPYQLYYSVNDGFIQIDKIDNNGVYIPTFTIVN